VHERSSYEACPHRAIDQRTRNHAAVVSG
jgi:hypothetical protein